MSQEAAAADSTRQEANSKPNPDADLISAEITELNARNPDGPSDQELAEWEPFGRFLGEAMRVRVHGFIGPDEACIGRFQILRVLGHGGSGTVYCALDPLLKREVAIKVPHQVAVSSEHPWERFLQEGTILSELSHSNIVAIFEIGFHHDCPFLVFEYCSAGALADWLARQSQSLAPHVCARIILTLAAAAEYAHAHGILHRDVNPRNVLLLPLPESQNSSADDAFPFLAKLSDFGLGTWLDEQKTAVQTQSGAVMGTLPYMAPEQTKASKSPLQATVDVYALGVMLYELLTRQRPFVGGTAAETLRLIQEAQPIRPRVLRTEIPRDLETICLKCLEKLPAKRYQSAANLAADLDRLLSGNPIRARRVSPWEKAFRWVARRRQQLSIATLVLLLVATIGIGGSWYSAKLNNAKVSDQRLQSELMEIQERGRHANYIDQIAAMSGLVQKQSFNDIQRLRKWIPTSAEESDFRGFEWYYLMRLCGGDIVRLTTLVGPDEEVEALHVSESGASLFLACKNQLTEWDVGTGRQIRLVHESVNSIRDFAVSQQRNELVIAEYQSPNPEILELTAGRAQRRPYQVYKPVYDASKDEAWCNRVFYDPQQTRLFFVCAGSRTFQKPCQIVMYPTKPAASFWNLPHIPFRLFDVVVDPTTDQLVTTANDGIYVRASKREPEQFLQLPTFENAMTTSIAISNNGQLLAASTENRDILLCRKNALKQWEYQAKLPVTNRRIITTSHQLPHNRNPVRFNANAQRLLAMGSSHLQLWDVPRRKSLCTVSDLPGHDLRYLELLPDGRTAVWASDRVFGLWRPIEDIPQITGHPKETWSVAFSPDGRLLATGSDDESVRLWNLASGEMLHEFKGHEATVAKVAFSPQGNLLASAGFDQTIRIWDVAARRHTRTLTGSAGTVRALAWFADGKRLVTSDSPKSDYPPRVLIWDAITGTLLQTLDGFTDHIHTVAVTTDQRFVIATSNDKSIRVWKIQGGTLSRQWTNESNIRSATLLNQERWLATGGNDGVIKIRDLETGTVLLDLIGHLKPVLTLAISPDGRVLASGGEDRTVRLWDAVTGRSLMVLTDQTTQINCVSFSPAGDILASGAHDGSIKLRYGPRFKPLLSEDEQTSNTSTR